MNIINLTSHDVSVRDDNEEMTVFKPSGSVARTESKLEEVGRLGTIPVLTKTFECVEFDIDIKPYTIYIVSCEVLKALKELGHPLIHQFVSPNTIWAKRTEDRRIDSVKGFLVL